MNFVDNITHIYVTDDHHKSLVGCEVKLSPYPEIILDLGLDGGVFIHSLHFTNSGQKLLSSTVGFADLAIKTFIDAVPHTFVEIA